MQTQKAIENELKRIDTIRTDEEEERLSNRQRYELMGAQQALAWVVGTGMMPTLVALFRIEGRAMFGIQD